MNDLANILQKFCIYCTKYPIIRRPQSAIIILAACLYQKINEKNDYYIVTDTREKGKPTKQTPASYNSTTKKPRIQAFGNASIVLASFCIVIIWIVSDASHFLFSHTGRAWSQAEINILTCFCCSGSESRLVFILSLFHSHFGMLLGSCSVHARGVTDDGPMVIIRQKRYRVFPNRRLPPGCHVNGSLHSPLRLLYSAPILHTIHSHVRLMWPRRYGPVNIHRCFE